VVSGVVQVNGATPSNVTCNSFQTINFTHLTDTRFNASTTFCTSGTGAWTWTVRLYPGNYRVQVESDRNNSALPAWNTDALASLSVSAPQSNVVLNVPVPPEYVVSGVVQVNGATPSNVTCNSFQTINFTHLTDTRFNASTTFCTSGTGAWTWNVRLYPGNYRVQVESDRNNSALPAWNTDVISALVIP
jgi:hypothetical protein